MHIVFIDPEGKVDVPALAEQPTADATGDFELLFTVDSPLIPDPIPGRWRAEISDNETGRTVVITFCITQ
jgi:hypothetical protein